VNWLYCIGSILLDIVFIFQGNWAMVLMYNILLGFAIRGILNHKYREQLLVRERVMGIFSPPTIQDIDDGLEQLKLNNL
jgi:hypothetical protein